MAFDSVSIREALPRKSPLIPCSLHDDDVNAQRAYPNRSASFRSIPLSAFSRSAAAPFVEVSRRTTSRLITAARRPSDPGIIEALEAIANDQDETIDDAHRGELTDLPGTMAERREAILPGYRAAYLYSGGR
jgi:hypothetical protein